MSDTVLLVEDEPALARGLVDCFQHAGFEVQHLSRGDGALAAIRSYKPDVVVLDIMLPGLSGLDVLRELRAAGIPVPVVMLTAKGDIIDKVFGLELGADDYVPKPFSVHELLARVRALLRRSRRETSPAPESLQLGGIQFDFRALTARGPARAAQLTLHDVLVLKVLASRRARSSPGWTSSKRFAASTRRPRFGPSTTTSSPCGARSATIRGVRAFFTRCAAKAIVSAFPRADTRVTLAPAAERIIRSTSRGGWS